MLGSAPSAASSTALPGNGRRAEAAQRQAARTTSNHVGGYHSARRDRDRQRAGVAEGGGVPRPAGVPASMWSASLRSSPGKGTIFVSAQRRGSTVTSRGTVHNAKTSYGASRIEK